MYLFYKRQKIVLEDQVPVFSEEIPNKKFVDECLCSFCSSGNNEWQIQLLNEYICIHIYWRQSWNILKQKRFVLWKREIKVTLVSKAVTSLWKVSSAGGKSKTSVQCFCEGKRAASVLQQAAGYQVSHWEGEKLLNPAVIGVSADVI